MFLFRYGAMLLVFFFTASKLTKVGEEKKRRVDADFKEGGQRNWYSSLFCWFLMDFNRKFFVFFMANKYRLFSSTFFQI